MEPIQLADAPMPNRATRRAAGRRARKLAALSSGAVLAGSAGAAVMSVIAATPAGALTTFTVINNNDAGAGSLREAVDDATADADASEIVFASNVTGTITLTTGRLEVDGGGDLTVTGPGASVLTVNGNANDNIFYSDGSFGDDTLSISGLTLTNGDETDGGAIEFYDDDGGTQSLVLTNMVITGNHADSDGGGVYFYTDGDMTVTNTVISGNFATDDGGGDEGGGVFFYNGDTLTITNSTISGNTADDDAGGIGFYSGNILTITNSTISGNTSGDDGGGLYFYGSSATIANSTFAGNSAADNGGAIAVFYAEDITLLQSTISGNTAGELGDGLYLTGTGASSVSEKSDRSQAALAEERGPDKEPKAAKPPRDTVGAQDAGTVTLVGTIVSANPGTDIDTDTTAAVDSTNSLWGTKGAGITINDVGGTINTSAPGLAGLADNGGPTQTMALVPGSPAIDTGPDPVPSFSTNANDQRGAGFPRVVNGRVDIGAYEVQPIVVRFTG